MEKRREDIVSFDSSTANKKQKLQAMREENIIAAAVADMENENPNKGSKSIEINPGGASKVCRFCHMETDHGRELCPLRDVSKKLESPNDLRISFTEVPRLYIVKENARENAVIVRKLSVDTCEADLLKLFGTFGNLRFVRVAKTKTAKCHHFALVSFVDIDDAERAMNKLNADGYDIEWFVSTPPLP